MAKEEKLRSKLSYKIFLILLKYIPILIALFYMANTITCYFGIDLPVLSNIAGMSLLSWLFVLIATFVFKFCVYHRLFLYYILIDDIISICNYYFTIPIEDGNMLMIHTSLIGILIFVILIVHVKSNKGDSSKNH